MEVQGTGEKTGFSRQSLDAMLDGAVPACEKIFALQRRAIAESKRM